MQSLELEFDLKEDASVKFTIQSSGQGTYDHSVEYAS